jgi:hypothetical protein
MIRELSETLVDIAESMLPEGEGIVRVESAVIELPLEVRLAKVDGTYLLQADVPRWRWSTDFDSRPGRIRLDLQREVVQ